MSYKCYNAQISLFTGNCNSLPSQDPMGLYDRQEFWIINEHAFDDRLQELDEYRFVFDITGDIYMYRNDEPRQSIACADASQIFYPFVFIKESNFFTSSFSIPGIPFSVSGIKILSN